QPTVELSVLPTLEPRRVTVKLTLSTLGGWQRSRIGRCALTPRATPNASWLPPERSTPTTVLTRQPTPSRGAPASASAHSSGDFPRRPPYYAPHSKAFPKISPPRSRRPARTRTRSAP